MSPTLKRLQAIVAACQNLSELAREAGCSRRTLQNIKNGAHSPVSSTADGIEAAAVRLAARAKKTRGRRAT